jgi:organic radical activating enzyme
MKYNLESFCPEAWSQIEIDAEGDFKLCCLANYDKDFGMAIDKDGNVMNVMTHSIDEAMNSETHKEHRLQMSRNEKPRRCRNCYDSEDATKGLPEFKERAKNGISKRQRVLNNTARVADYISIETVEQETNADGTLKNPAKIVNLDLRFGNLCNQKCIMCSPQHSNQWYDDWVAIGYGDPQYNRGKGVYKKGQAKEFEFFKDEHGRTKMKGIEPWWESERWWNLFDKLAPNLQYIYFTGGEPLIVPQMQECLDKLIERGFAKNIQLRYDTNLSVVNQKVIDKWKHFKNIFLCISVDDTYERYNTIRFPGNFEKIENNIKQLKENGIDIHYISTCVGIASPYSVQRIYEFGKKYNIETNFRFLEGPNWLDIRNYPREAKLEIIKNLEEYSDDPEYTKWARAEIRLLKKYMNYSEEKHLKEFIRVMDVLDKQRGTNWRSALPDVVELYKKYMPELYKEKD